MLTDTGMSAPLARDTVQRWDPLHVSENTVQRPFCTKYKCANYCLLSLFTVQLCADTSPSPPAMPLSLLRPGASSHACPHLFITHQNSLTKVRPPSLASPLSQQKQNPLALSLPHPSINTLPDGRSHLSSEQGSRPCRGAAPQTPHVQRGPQAHQHQRPHLYRTPRRGRGHPFRLHRSLVSR